MLEAKTKPSTVGMGHLENHLKEMQEATAALHLNFVVPEFAAGDAEGARAAIARMEALVDEWVAPWKHNPAVRGMAEQTKKRFRAEMEKKAKQE